VLSNKRMNLAVAAWYRRAAPAGYPQCWADVGERVESPMRVGALALAVGVFACTTGTSSLSAATLTDVWYCARSEYAAVVVPPNVREPMPKLWIIQPSGCAGEQPAVRSVVLRDAADGVSCGRDRVYVRFGDGAESRDITTDPLVPTPVVDLGMQKVAGQVQKRLKPGHLYEVLGGEVTLAFTEAAGRQPNGDREKVEALFISSLKTMHLVYATHWSTVRLD
jgi:hypothetical protein